MDSTWRFTRWPTFEDQLIVGGRFTHHGSTELNGIARWDGEAWRSMAGGLSHWVTPEVRVLTVFDGQLHAGGLFLDMGGERVNNLARWDGSSWHALGDGLTRADIGHLPVVNALLTDGNSLLVGGVFMAADGNRDIRHLARWRDDTYRALGERLGFREGRFGLTLFPDRGMSYGLKRQTTWFTGNVSSRSRALKKRLRSSMRQAAGSRAGSIGPSRAAPSPDPHDRCRQAGTDS
jgi:hypothetical protein